MTFIKSKDRIFEKISEVENNTISGRQKVKAIFKNTLKIDDIA